MSTGYLYRQPLLNTFVFLFKTLHVQHCINKTILLVMLNKTLLDKINYFTLFLSNDCHKASLINVKYESLHCLMLF